MISAHNIPILGFVAFSGTGKTTLLKKLIPLLSQKGIRVGMIKHAHHEFDIDKPGKDSYELRKAGATQMLVASSQRWALMVETPAQSDAVLSDLVAQLDHSQLDLILVEGFKHETYPKIELHRPSLGHPVLCQDDPNIIAFACDTPPTTQITIPVLDINTPASIADFIQSEI